VVFRARSRFGGPPFRWCSVQFSIRGGPRFGGVFTRQFSIRGSSIRWCFCAVSNSGVLHLVVFSVQVLDSGVLESSVVVFCCSFDSGVHPFGGLFLCSSRYSGGFLTFWWFVSVQVLDRAGSYHWVVFLMQ
jgi:hypothetical protein